jgi:hypothetical protein
MTDLLGPPAAPPEPPRIDPRFARRWVEARRAEGRRRLHVLLAVAAVVVCAGLAVGSLYSPLLHVRHLRVTVDGPLSSVAVGGLTGVTRSTPMIEVNPSRIAAHLASDPWLGGVRVTRSWPGTVAVSVAVRRPIAVVATGTGWAQIDPTGRVLADLLSLPAGTPALQGLPPAPSPGSWLTGTAGPQAPPGAPAAGLADMSAAGDGPDVPAGPAAALALLRSLPGPLLSEILSIQVGPGAPLSLVVNPPLLSGPVTVLLGDGSRLAAKVTALQTMLDQGDLTGVVGIDLSVPSRPATVSSAGTLSTLLAPASRVAPAAAQSTSKSATAGQP